VLQSLRQQWQCAAQMAEVRCRVQAAAPKAEGRQVRTAECTLQVRGRSFPSAVFDQTPLDGLAATRQIRTRWPEARIIFVTSHDEPRFRDAASQLKVEGYVLKENLDQINQIVRKSPDSGKTSI